MSTLKDLIQSHSSVNRDRMKSLDSLAVQGMPNKKFENFKFTSFSNFNSFFVNSLEAKLKRGLDVASAPPRDTQIKEILNKLPKNDFKKIVFADGHLIYSDQSSEFKVIQQSFSDYILCAKSFADEVKKNENAQTNDLSTRLRLAVKEKHLAFSSFNLGAGQCFYKIEINKSLTAPLQIIYINESDEIHPVSLNVEVFENVTAQIIETHQSINADTALIADSNQMIQMVYGNFKIFNGANLLHLIESKSKCHNIFGDRKAYVFSNCIYDQVFVQEGMKTQRQDSEIHLLGQHSEVQSLGSCKGFGTSHGDHYISIYHHLGENISKQFFKSLLSDSAIQVFRGLIYMAPGAHGAASEQLNNNLLLSEKTEAISLPQLEIYVDDVKAAHGSTVGELNAEEVFYLQSRGLSKTKSIEMLSKGFLTEVFFKLKQQNLFGYLLGES